MDALSALARDFEPRRSELVRRATVIRSVPDLAERELLKLRNWSQALSRLVLESGGDQLTAYAQVEVALALFRAARIEDFSSPRGPSR